VEIVFAMSGGWLRLTIRDNGKGFDPGQSGPAQNALGFPPGQ
jgi:signal transduction histidine kinase